MILFKTDFAAARIEFLNVRGQRADFHSLGHTLATNLALAGAAPIVAMEVMRHSDMRLTANIYTDAGLLPISEAIAMLPSFTAPPTADSQIDSQNSFRRGPDLSSPRKEKKRTFGSA